MTDNNDENINKFLTRIQQASVLITPSLHSGISKILKFNSNIYLERVNNWIIVSSGAIFSVIYSNIDKAGKFIEPNSSKTLIILMLFEIVISVTSKVLLSWYRLNSEDSLFIMNDLQIKSEIKNNLREHLIKDFESKSSNFTRVEEKRIKSLYRNIIRFGKTVDKQFTKIKKLSRNKHRINKAVLFLMCIQVGVFAVSMYILVLLFMPK